ncbi:hypothetical protein SMI10712_01951 [Streptococcus mitis]|uniref:Uncharacterized protein n=1 Tax=Streptococcus mitis TaxID=28037 RepID=A0A150NIM4_STRMT|nr:hypothetical protein SMI10712_01951 [Streptococcus mitis]
MTEDKDNKIVVGAYKSSLDERLISEEEASQIVLSPPPKVMFLSVSKLHHKLPEKPISIGEGHKIYINSTKQSKIPIGFRPTSIDGIEFGELHLSFYELKLIDIIGTLIYKQPESSKNITVDQIYRILIGKPRSKHHASKVAKERIISDMKKLSSIWVSIDFSKHYEGRNEKLRKEGKPIIYDSISKREMRLLDFQIFHMESGTTYFNFSENPFLYQYSEDVGNIISTDFKLLQTPKEVRNPFDGFAIATYLIDRINSIKNNPSAKNMTIINFSSLIEMIEHNNNYKLTPTKKRTLRNSVEAILEKFVQEGALSGYSITGKQIAKLKITLKL